MPECRFRRHSVNHLFACDAAPTALSAWDLWINPIPAIILKMLPSFSHLPVMDAPLPWNPHLSGHLRALGDRGNYNNAVLLVPMKDQKRRHPPLPLPHGAPMGTICTKSQYNLKVIFKFPLQTKDIRLDILCSIGGSVHP